MTREIVLWPEEVIQLNMELSHTDLHPQLAEIMHNLDPACTFAERLGHIAAYCDLMLDGEYMPEDIAKICGELCKRLEKKRVMPKAQVIIGLN
jgi:hypothetical protein